MFVCVCLLFYTYLCIPLSPLCMSNLSALNLRKANAKPKKIHTKKLLTSKIKQFQQSADGWLSEWVRAKKGKYLNLSVILLLVLYFCKLNLAENHMYTHKHLPKLVRCSFLRTRDLFRCVMFCFFTTSASLFFVFRYYSTANIVLATTLTWNFKN